MKRNVSETEKKVVAARQEWKCADCHKLLSSAYQVDHRVALVDGGSNRLDNLAALCPNCHAIKTQLECIARADRIFKEKKHLAYKRRAAKREDVRVPGTDLVRCSLCHETRLRTETSWSDHECSKLKADSPLSQFAFAPRTSLEPTPLRKIQSPT